MVRMFLKDKNEYIDFEYSSILKTYFIGWIGWTLIMGLGVVILFFLVSIS